MSSDAGNNHQGIVQPRGFPPLPEGWESEWETYRSADDSLQLFSSIHQSKALQVPHRALVVVHGFGEHGGRYLHFPHYLKTVVDRIIAPDHRGHGRSEGVRGHVDRFDLYVDDLALVIRRLDERLRAEHGTSEIHLFGHSMGGLVALRLMMLEPELRVRSVMISAPLLGLRVKVPVQKKIAAYALSSVWGSLQLASEIDPAVLSHDREVADAYRRDRLVHMKATPRYYTEMQKAMADTLARESGIQAPLLMLVPLQDQVVDPEATLDFFRRLKHRDKHLRTYPDFFHESVNEIGKERVFDEIRQWIAGHSQTLAQARLEKGSP